MAYRTDQSVREGAVKNLSKSNIGKTPHIILPHARRLKKKQHENPCK
jgi:hypothetical protein